MTPPTALPIRYDSTMKLFPEGESRGKSVVRLLVAVAMTVMGVLHFVRTDDFARTVPDWLPAHVLLVQVSGVFEILGGVGLLVAPVRRVAALGLVLLYIAVFPANVHMATHHIGLGDTAVSPAVLWVRLPFQLVFIAIAIWLARPGGHRRFAGRAGDGPRGDGAMR